MYLSSINLFMIWLVIALITSCIYVMRRGGDDDHDQGAGAAGLPALCFLNRFIRREGRKMREGQEVKELEVEANYDRVKDELEKLMENIQLGEVITIEIQTIGREEHEKYRRKV